MLFFFRRPSFYSCYVTSLTHNNNNAQEIGAGDKLGVRYTGYLEKTPGSRERGAVFDSNVQSGKVFVFTLGEGAVIKGMFGCLAAFPSLSLSLYLS